MIPFRGDQFNQFNNPQPVHRHMVLYPQQQQQPPLPQQQHIIQHPSLMYTTSTHNFHQPYPGNPPMQQQPLMFIPSRPHPQQSWIMSSPPAPVPLSVTSMPSFIPAPPNSFHHVQSPQLPPQPSFSGSTGIPQPSFSGGTMVSQSSFNNSANKSQPLLGSGTGIPQPSFSGGTAVLKRKSHCLDESDYNSPSKYEYEKPQEFPSLMSISTSTFSNDQHHHRFQSINPRFNENPGPRSRMPLLPSPSGNLYNNQLSNPQWTTNDQHVYTPTVPSQMIPPNLNEQQQHQQQQQQVLTSQLFQKHQRIPIDMLLKEPNRSQRPSQIIIFLRGLPGSGKSYVADLIKNEEELQSKGQNKPKILSIDSYFFTDNQRETKDPKTGKITKTSVMEYEYDPQMEEAYRRSLIKQVRKSIDDRFFPFIIVDQNNEQLSHFRDMADYAEANQFQVYFVELNNDLQTCTQRNIHKRTFANIEQIHKSWEQLPLRYEILDIRSLLQSDAIDEVEMDDAPQPTVEENEPKEADEEEQEDSQITKKSKWEAMMETNPDRLDGLYQRRTSSPSTMPSSPPLEKRLNNTTISIDEQLSNDLSPNLQSKKKKVRWADIEENVLHLHKKAVGFVVGQTEQDWQRMSDDYDPTQKLNQYKYI